MSIPITDPNLFWPGGPSGGSTGNGLAWSIDSGGAAATCACPNYFEFALNMPASGSATLNFTTTPTGGSDFLYNAYLKVIVDGGVATITDITGTTSLSLITGATAGTHQFVIELMQCNNLNWSNAASGQSLCVSSITAAGSSTVAVTTNPSLMLVYGDSRTGGYNILGSANNPSNDWSICSARAIGDALGCEVAGHCFGGLGWMNSPEKGGTWWPTNTNCPPGLFIPSQPANSSWNQIYYGQSRVFPSVLKYVLVQGLGVNDALNAGITGYTPAEITTAITDFLVALRAAIPASTRILINPSWAGAIGNDSSWTTSATLINATILGVTNYLASTGDPLCWVINTGLSAIEQTYAYAYSADSYWCPTDGLHPLLIGHQIIGARTLQSISQIEGRLLPRIGTTQIGRA